MNKTVSIGAEAIARVKKASARVVTKTNNVAAKTKKGWNTIVQIVIQLLTILMRILYGTIYR